jgi:zeta-carotene isomerase
MSVVSQVEARTSTVPFAAILDGRQQLPRDYWKEWLRVPYAAVVIFTIGTYYAHPVMQRAAYWLGW